MSLIKTANEIQKMRQGGQILAEILHSVVVSIKPGTVKNDLEARALKLMQSRKVEPSFLGFKGYPKVSCISINEEIVHGLPDETAIRQGDIVSVDLGIKWQNLCLDAARTIGVGKISTEAEKLIKVCQLAFDQAFQLIRPGVNLGTISAQIAQTIESQGMIVIRSLSGHGIGQLPQEEPTVPNFGQKDTGIKLQSGMALAIEPMATSGSGEIHIKNDGWTIVTLDRSLSSHYEDTIVVTQNGAENLTGHLDR